MLVKIKLNTRNTRKKDTFVKRGLVGVITVIPFHNHSLKPAETINFLPAEECKIKEEDTSSDDVTIQASENSIKSDNRRQKNERLVDKLKFDESFKDNLGNVSLDTTSSCSSESHLFSSNQSLENSIVTNKICQKNEISESLLVKIKCEDSSNEELGNFSFDPTSKFNSESLHNASNHSSENNLQANNKRQKKDLSEKLLNLLGKKLEKFEASKPALELAVKQLKKISAEDDWESMVATLGSSVSSTKEREAAIMAQYIPIAPKAVKVTPSIVSQDIRLTNGSTLFTYGHPPIESQMIKIEKNNF